MFGGGQVLEQNPSTVPNAPERINVLQNRTLDDQWDINTILGLRGAKHQQTEDEARLISQLANLVSSQDSMISTPIPTIMVENVPPPQQPIVGIVQQPTTSNSNEEEFDFDEPPPMPSLTLVKSVAKQITEGAPTEMKLSLKRPRSSSKEEKNSASNNSAGCSGLGRGGKSISTMLVAQDESETDSDVEEEESAGKIFRDTRRRLKKLKSSTTTIKEKLMTEYGKLGCDLDNIEREVQKLKAEEERMKKRQIDIGKRLQILEIEERGINALMLKITK